MRLTPPLQATSVPTEGTDTDADKMTDAGGEIVSGG